MRLLVTGAGGMLGRRVVRVAEAAGHEVLAPPAEELDVTDAQAVFDALAGATPDAVVHCAAHTDVDGAESDEEGATRVNGTAAGHVAAGCARHGAFLVHVSTDYVFAGERGDGRPYVEDDEPAPRTAYGRSKLAGERAVAGSGAEHAIARTAWLFGAGGTNFVDTVLGLAARREVLEVVADQHGSPTWTGHLAPALLELAERRLAGTHHVAGGGCATWHDLASAAVATRGLACRVVPTTTERFPRPAPRPAWSVLAATRADTPRLPPWGDGLAGHLAEAGA